MVKRDYALLHHISQPGSEAVELLPGCDVGVIEVIIKDQQTFSNEVCPHPKNKVSMNC